MTENTLRASQRRQHPLGEQQCCHSPKCVRDFLALALFTHQPSYQAFASPARLLYTKEASHSTTARRPEGADKDVATPATVTKKRKQWQELRRLEIGLKKAHLGAIGRIAPRPTSCRWGCECVRRCARLTRARVSASRAGLIQSPAKSGVLF